MWRRCVVGCWLLLLFTVVVCRCYFMVLLLDVFVAALLVFVVCWHVLGGAWCSCLLFVDIAGCCLLLLCVAVRADFCKDLKT